MCQKYKTFTLSPQYDPRTSVAHGVALQVCLPQTVLFEISKPSQIWNSAYCYNATGLYFKASLACLILSHNTQLEITVFC